MASGATTTVSVVKAGYWFCGSRYFTRSVHDMPSELFTHLYAGFAEVNAISGEVTCPEQYSDQFKTFTKTVKERSPKVQTLLSIGGEGSHISPVVKVEDRRQKFISSSIELARDIFHFDGLDLCWLYPSSSDKDEDLATFLDEWRAELKKDAKKRGLPELLLTAAVFHHPVIPGEDNNNAFNYPCQAILRNLDWINVLAIDLYTPSNSPGETGPVHAWRTRYTEPTRCGSDGIEKWKANIKAAYATSQKLQETNSIAAYSTSQKIVLGLPFYGYKWILDDPNICASFFAPAHPATDTNPISYRNIPPSPRKRSEYYVASYVQNKGSWFGFDDVHDISTKVSKAIHGDTDKLGGYFAWTVGDDDDEWTLSRAASKAAE